MANSTPSGLSPALFSFFFFFPVKTLCGPDPFPPRHRTRLLSLYKHEVRFPADGSSRLQRPLFQTSGRGGGEGGGGWAPFVTRLSSSSYPRKSYLVPRSYLSLSLPLSLPLPPSSFSTIFRGINRRRMRPVPGLEIKNRLGLKGRAPLKRCVPGSRDSNSMEFAAAVGGARPCEREGGGGGE